MFKHIVLIAVVMLPGCSKVEDPSLYPIFDASVSDPPPEKTAATRNENRTVFWGDLHIHTSLSFDAYTLGVRAMPDEAYTYMKGGTIEHGMGYAIRAKRPLDFGAVTDHAEFLGVARELDKNSAGENKLREVMETGNALRITLNFLVTVFSQMSSAEKRQDSFGQAGMEAVSRASWQEIIDTAERHNSPGVFTSFIAYEWTSMPNEDNLHRNVIYKTSQVPEFPYSALDSDNPEDLWDALDKQRDQGMEVFAIPHNSNVSNGTMYRQTDFKGAPISKVYAQQRLYNEPLSEAFQVKGASETHPVLSSEDEFAGFEIYDQRLASDGGRSEPKGSYIRDALRTGIELSHSEGFNPYRFGVIGSSDSHNASFEVEEDNYHGKLPLIDGSAGLRLGETLLLPKAQNRGGRWSAMGLAGVWAEENTRASLFDAMRRKETYATSGPRITLRFFAGWNYPDDFFERPERVELAYASGVAMGGNLVGSSSRESPVFLVWAAKDPEGANLDRIQIIKGWIDTQGNSQEKIFNISASGNRQNDAGGQLASVGNTVDVTTATYTNSIGAGQLSALWRDPDYNHASEAFYYARVIEIPTPRFSTFDALTLGVEAPEPASIQERAISSAIWYRPD